MKSFLKIFSVVFLVMAVGVAAITALMFVAFRNAGFATVAVHDRSEGMVVTAPIPLLPIHVVSSVMGGLPVHVEWDHHDVPDVRRELTAMLSEIEAGPDAQLFELYDGGDRIVVQKRGHQLELEIDDGWDEVKISIPIRTARRFAASVD